jgi:hypothetical protein
MFLRQLRWLAAAVAVACLAPASARAEIQVLVEELDASGVTVGQSAFAVGVPSGGSTFFQGFSYSTTGGHFTLDGTAGTNSHRGTVNASLSTSFTAGFTSNFDPSQGHTLRITITDDKYTSAGAASVLTNTAGVASGFAGGTVQVDSFSSILQTPLTVPASSTTELATGTTIGGPTPVATDMLPVPPVPTTRVTTANMSSLPPQYAIQQVIIISINQTGPIDPAATFTGSAGARVDPRPIPTPSALALALIGLPLIGLRRVLRKRTPV